MATSIDNNYRSRSSSEWKCYYFFHD